MSRGPVYSRGPLFCGKRGVLTFAGQRDRGLPAWLPLRSTRVAPAILQVRGAKLTASGQGTGCCSTDSFLQVCKPNPLQ